MASSLDTGRSTTGWPYVRPSPCTPTERTSASSTTGHCQIVRSSPAAESSSRDTARGDRPDGAGRETRAGQGLPRDDRLRQAELGPDGADLVLEQRAQRLD